MLSVFAAFGFADLCLAFAALELFTFLDPQCGGAGAGTMASAEAPPLVHGAAEVLPPLAAAAALFVAVALTYHHLMAMGRRRHVAAVPVPVPGAGNDGRRSIVSELVIFVLCVSAGTLEFILFGFGNQQAAGAGGGAEDHGGAQARALGLAALRTLPAAATASFFVGMTLIIIVIAHVRAGGEGGGGAGVAGDGPTQGLLRLLTKIAAGAAAALVGLMAMALTLHGVRY